jgi:poly(beta-D-mannuronate) lyase
MTHRIRVNLLTVAIFVICTGAIEVSAQGACPTYTPVMEVTGVRWYNDEKSSIVNPEKQAENWRLQKEVRAFIDGLSTRLDQLLERGPDTDVSACIQQNLMSWAHAGALLKTPTWSAPRAEQTKTIVALQFIFLKLKTIGNNVSKEVQVWRRQSLDSLLRAYENPSHQNNLYVWSGVAAAAGDLLEKDDRLRCYHEAVWRFAINSISGDGTVAFEMARGQRALIYHTFFYNALSALSRLREALGLAIDEDQAAAIRRLSEAIGKAACDPSPFEHKSGAPQEPLDRWNLAMAEAFGANYNSLAWARCTQAPEKFPGPGWGGRFDLTVKSIKKVSNLVR